MFIRTVKSDGLAHLSYVIGSDGEAAIIDPRRDCERYVEIAAAQGCRITNIFETHRNEDLLSGAPVLAARTGATVYHGPNAAGEVVYAKTARDGDEFAVGNALLRVLETPGHTDDSLSYALFDEDFDDGAVAVFTGDALFVGDVGRTDFYPDRAREVAGLLYDSLQKLLALGDQAIVHPAHGAGSVCGSGMADRDVSTIGHERANNPRLRIDDRDAFIEAKLAEHHDLPPYFELMERLNLTGAGPAPGPLAPPPLTADALREQLGGRVLVDVRSVPAWLGAHLPGSLALPLHTVSSFGGWLLEPQSELLLVADDAAQAGCAARRFARMGYDHVAGYLADPLTAWAAGGGRFGALSAVSVRQVRDRVENAPADWTLLDVRPVDEVSENRIDGARHIYLGELPRRLDELDRAGRYTVMCGSGTRATIAASILSRARFEKVDVFLGSLGAWMNSGLETAEGAPS